MAAGGKPTAELAARFVESLVMLLEELGSPPDAEERRRFERAFRDLGGDGTTAPLADPVLFFRAAHFLAGDRQPTMSRLSERLMIPQATATRLVDRLVRQGLAQRVADPEDRRVVRVTLTEQGNDFHRTMKRFAVRRVQRVLGELSPGEQETFVALLNRLAQAGGDDEAGA